MKKKDNEKKKIKKRFRWKLWLFIGIMITLLSFFGTKAFLMINFYLGNDIVIKLETDKEYIDLKRLDKEDLEIISTVNTNPFCSASCTYTFEDLSHGKIIEEQNITLDPLHPMKRQYEINADWKGKGQVLFRANMVCTSKSSFLCHTKERPTTRKILIPVNYKLNDKDLLNMAQVFEKSKIAINNINDSLRYLELSRKLINEASEKINLDKSKEILSGINQENDNNINRLFDAEISFSDYKFSESLDEIDKVINNSKELEISLNNLTQELIIIKNTYNDLVYQMNRARTKLLYMKDLAATNKDALISINKTLSRFNKVIIIMDVKSPLEVKKTTVNELFANTDFLIESYEKTLLNKKISLEKNINTTSSKLCDISGFCINYTGNKTMQRTCDQAKEIIEEYAAINRSLNEINASNETLGIINSINITSIECKLINMTKYEIASLNSTRLRILNNHTLEEQDAWDIGIRFSEPEPICCLEGYCEACCDECKEDKDMYPLMLIHGHAVSESVSAEFSAENLIPLQTRLEEDRYFIDAGTISLYSEYDIPKGIWGRINKPISIKASYYYDIFKTPSNYKTVQLKSENIDTYAIRLRDLVDILLYRTGKEKVKIIAHSMGGLVTRRYMQLFGDEKVHEVILIGTPNHGITGKIENLCPLTGSKLECRDMSEGSVFLSKLNNGEKPDIPLHVIVGKGCDMQGKDGDGIVTTENVPLKWANKYHIEGTCKGFNTLHVDLQDPKKYPESYSIIEDVMVS
ncbi:MAG: alpha/beta fold hydrolase [Candidatus Woesearchaeota archaeon]